MEIKRLDIDVFLEDKRRGPNIPVDDSDDSDEEVRKKNIVLANNRIMIIDFPTHAERHPFTATQLFYVLANYRNQVRQRNIGVVYNIRKF